MITSDDEAELHELASLSARLGRDPLLVQGAGGNTSIKLGNLIWVKASGMWLANALDSNIFLPLDLSVVQRNFKKGICSAEVFVTHNHTELRPSIEVTMHAVLPHKIVLHLHSVNAIAHSIRFDSLDILAKKLAGISWCSVSYVKPGIPLAQAIDKNVREGIELIILANHGLVIAANDFGSAREILDEVETRLWIKPRQVPIIDYQQLDFFAKESDYRVPQFPEAHVAAVEPESHDLATAGAFYPDHVVFLGASPLLSISARNARQRIRELRLRDKVNPAIIIISGVGVLIRSDLGQSAEEMVRCLGLVLLRLEKNLPVVYLTKDQETELLEWESENYRRSVNEKSSGA